MVKQNKKLVEQSEALSDFFESLMQDVNAYQDEEQRLSAQHTDTDVSSINENITTTSLEQIPNSGTHLEYSENDLQTEFSQDVIPEQQIKSSEPADKLFETLPPVMPEPEIIEEIKPVTELLNAEIQVEEITQDDNKNPLSEELPEWCQHDFQAMLFKVAGLTLAVPLVDLNGVVECDLKDVSTMPGHADFYFGLMHYLDKNVPLVDTAKFVLPVDKLSTLAGDDPAARITRAVLIHDCQFGLACDEVNEVVTLRPEDVRWRTQRTQRRWLAGTVIEHMCALIDATAFAELLADQTPVQAFRE